MINCAHLWIHPETLDPPYCAVCDISFDEIITNNVCDHNYASINSDYLFCTDCKLYFRKDEI